MRTRGAVAVWVLGSFLLASCSHPVRINSNPPGARAYVDSQFIGVTPTSFVERSGLGKDYQVRLEKEGYRTLSTTEKQRVNPLYLVFSILFTCGIGIFWSFTLADQYDYHLERA